MEDQLKFSEFAAAKGNPSPVGAGFPVRDPCLRKIPAWEWSHKGWAQLSRVVAASCVAENDCDKCWAVLFQTNRRRPR